MSAKRWSMVAVGVLLAMQGAGAAEPAAPDVIGCNPDGVQIELNACARDEFERADAELNAAWKALLAALDSQPAAVKQARAAQRAWLAFRDAEVEAHFPLEDGEDPHVMYGSMYPMSRHGVMTTLTRQRTEQLRVRIDELGAY